jgi:hypothetical protein
MRLAKPWVICVFERKPIAGQKFASGRKQTLEAKNF